MSVSKSSIPFSWEGRTQRVQEQHPACFCSAGTKGNYERTAQGQNRSRLGAAPAVGGQAVPPLNASVTGTRWHKTKTTRRSDASPPAARRVLLCLTWKWLANRAAERLKPPSCTDGFLHQPRSGLCTGMLGPTRPLILTALEETARSVCCQEIHPVKRCFWQVSINSFPLPRPKEVCNCSAIRYSKSEEEGRIRGGNLSNLSNFQHPFVKALQYLQAK